MSLQSIIRLRSSITAQLTVMFTAAVVILLVANGVYHYRSLVLQLAGRQAATLNEKIAETRSRLVRYEAAELLADSAHDVMAVASGHSDLFLLIRDTSNRVLIASHPEEKRPPARAREPSGSPDSTWQAGGKQFRTISVATTIGPNRDPASVELTLDTTRDSQILRAFVYEVVLSLIVAVLAAGPAAYLIASRGLGSLHRFTRLANDITLNRLDRRLELDSVPLELHELAEAYNGMLLRLGTSFRRLVDFSGDLAHELRTPIHNLLGQTQVALSLARSPEEYRSVLESNVEEYERLSRVIRDMLFLAQADNAQLRLSREHVELGELAHRVAAVFDAAAEDARVEMSIHGEASVSGDRLMLERAIANLLSNALQHAKPQSRISIVINRSGLEAAVTVANCGAYVPPEVAARLFDRFFRRDTARFGEGVGLGLAIVKSIVDLHGGSVAVESDPGGETRFTLRIPITPSEVQINSSGSTPSTGDRNSGARAMQGTGASALRRTKLS